MNVHLHQRKRELVCGEEETRKEVESLDWELAEALLLLYSRRKTQKTKQHTTIGTRKKGLL